MNTPKLIAIFLAVFAITSYAENAAQLAATINSYNNFSGGGTGTISASYSGNTVTVTGEKIGATASLTLNIDANVSVIWKAELTGNLSENRNLIVIICNGSFEMLSGKIEQTGAGNAVYIESSIGAVTTISGGEVLATTGRAVDKSVFGEGTLNISGGTVSAGIAIVNSKGTLNISGGEVSATGYCAVSNSGTLNISGGMVSATGHTAVENFNGTLNISGGTVSATGETAVDNFSGTLNISGGMVLATSGYAIYRSDVTVTLTGGAVFASGTGVTDVIEGTYTADGNAAIIAWDKSANTTTYTALGNTDIFSATPTTATWNGRGGIAYANGANTGFIPIEGVMVNKLTGLENDAPPHFSISAAITQEHTYSMHTLALNKNDHGELSYSIATTPTSYQDPGNILAAKPTLNGTTLTYKGTGKTNGEATLQIIIESDNYEPITATLTFEATPKPEVTITGITAKDEVYDGTPKKGYSGVATSGAYTGALVYEYAGTDYPQTATPPTNVGEYTLRITLPPEAPYTGEWRGTFSITADTPILPQISTGSIRVQTTANAIMLENLPRNTKVQIYSIQGKQIYSTNSENSQILRIPVQTKGMYIVKAGSQTLRVTIR
jgi:hypothetical protein